MMSSPVRLCWLLVAVGCIAGCRDWTNDDAKSSVDAGPIRVGVLHSLTGTMAISEKSVADATLLAIAELNDQGGLLGRQVEAVVADGQSDWSIFAREAERLITEEKVSAVFGCWTSASRKTVKPIFEAHGHLLFYPVQYEGLEQSPNIVYTGAVPSQQILPAVRWCFENLGQKFFLVGSDYVFPRTANEIIQEQLRTLHGKVVGVEYIPLASTQVQQVVRKIVETQPDVILNTINGDTNVAFFRELRATGITAEQIPTMSFSIAEDEVRTLRLRDADGDYACWNYFQSVGGELNRSFAQRFRNRYGQDRVTDDPMEAAYTAVHLWAQAVRDAGTDEVSKARAKVVNQLFEAPGGLVYVDPRSRHLWKKVRIGRVDRNGQFEIVWSSGKPVRPDPYPVYRTEEQWQAFLDGLHMQWGRSWAAPQGSRSTGRSAASDVSRK